MPSYRLLLTVGQIRAGVNAQSVLPTVGGVIAQHATVEAKDIKIYAGLPQLVIRFTGSDPQFARGLADQCLAEIDEIIEITDYKVTARSGNRWLPLQDPFQVSDEFGVWDTLQVRREHPRRSGNRILRAHDLS